MSGDSVELLPSSLNSAHSLLSSQDTQIIDPSDKHGPSPDGASVGESESSPDVSFPVRLMHEFTRPGPAAPKLNGVQTSGDKHSTTSIHNPTPPSLHEYTPPTWAKACPHHLGYRLTVLKLGIQMLEDAVDLAGCPTPSTISTHSLHSPSLADTSKADKTLESKVDEAEDTNDEKINEGSVEKAVDSDSDSVADGLGYSYCILGRQPRILDPDSGLIGLAGEVSNISGQPIVLAHPSVSRCHAVLQYGNGPSRRGHSETVANDEAQTDSKYGWYIMDLDSTHGTLVNKIRLPSGRFFRLHVGHVIKFGASTRIYILEGPDDDKEPELSAEVWQQLRKAKLNRANDYIGSDKKIDIKKPLPLSTEATTSELFDSSCLWGFQDELDEVPSLTTQPLDGASCLSHETSYLDDPKKALRAYFDREGIDPAPQFEFVDQPRSLATGSRSGLMCTIQLPLSNGNNLMAEVPVSSGRRKEAVIACALEACRILDRMGEFEPGKDSAEARLARRRARLEANDYYSSDEDTFLDRTGAVEQRRSKRMRHLGVPTDEQLDGEVLLSRLGTDYHSSETSRRKYTHGKSLNRLKLLKRLEDLGQQIIDLEEKVESAKLEVSEMPCSELDELEAYMQRVQSSSSRRSDRIRLKTQLMELRRDEARLLKQLGLPLASRARRRQSASSVPSSFSAADALRAARGSLRTEENSSELMSCEQNELDKFDLHQTASSLDPSNPLEHEDDSNTSSAPDSKSALPSPAMMNILKRSLAIEAKASATEHLVQSVKNPPSDEFLEEVDSDEELALPAEKKHHRGDADLPKEQETLYPPLDPSDDKDQISIPTCNTNGSILGSVGRLVSSVTTEIPDDQRITILNSNASEGADHLDLLPPNDAKEHAAITQSSPASSCSNLEQCEESADKDSSDNKSCNASCEHVGISEPSPVSPFLDPDFYEGLPSDSISLSIKGCAPPPEKQKNQLKLAKKSLSLEDRQSLERNDDSSTAGLSLSESDSGRKDHLQIQITENRPETLPDYIQGGLASDPDYILWMPPSDQTGDGETALNVKYGY